MKALAPTEEADDKKYFASNLSFRTFAYKENLFPELDRLVDSGQSFDGLIIDLMQAGFSLPLENLIKFSQYAKRLLKPQGVLLFVKANGAITLTRDDPSGGFTFNAYDNPVSIFARYPMLADYLCATVTGIDRRKLRGGGSTLANHILQTSIPVLTEKGRKSKNEFSLETPGGWLIQLIDDYATIETVTRTLEGRHQIPLDESMRMLQEIEGQGLIFPIFARIQFLSNCYHNRKPFRLGRYMVAAGIINEAQLQELLEQQEQEGWGKTQKIALGVLAVRAGYLNTRELEVLLDDQYLYGGYHKKSEEENVGTARGGNIETVRDSMIGSLGAIDPAGLLQSLVTAKKTGILTVENRDKVFVVAFSNGKPTHAKLNQLKGQEALTEFLIVWTEGIFVFRDKATAQELDKNCLLTQPLDRSLLDGALLQDQIVKILAGLPSGRNTTLERVENFDTLWQTLSKAPLKFLDDTQISDDDKVIMGQLAASIDGLATIDDIIRASAQWPSYLVIKIIYFFLEHKLVDIQHANLFRPLSIFQRIIAELQKSLGAEENITLLQSSLHNVHGQSSAAACFLIDQQGRVSLNLSQIKQTGTPIASVIMELRHWMEAYLVYCRRELDAQQVERVIAQVVNAEK